MRRAGGSFRTVRGANLQLGLFTLEGRKERVFMSTRNRELGLVVKERLSTRVKGNYAARLIIAKHRGTKQPNKKKR